MPFKRSQLSYNPMCEKPYRNQFPKSSLPALFFPQNAPHPKDQDEKHTLHPQDYQERKGPYCYEPFKIWWSWTELN